jgi:hypothetical protein
MLTFTVTYILHLPFTYILLSIKSMCFLLKDQRFEYGGIGYVNLSTLNSHIKTLKLGVASAWTRTLLGNYKPPQILKAKELVVLKDCKCSRSKG